MTRILLGILVIVALIYVFVNWQQGGQLFGFLPEKKVGLGDLLSYANFYNGKKICTQGYYVESPNLSIIKLNLDDDEYTKSIWVVNESDDKIILESQLGKETKYVNAKLCGLFMTQRAGEYGTPAVWNHQLNVSKFETLTYPQPVP